MMMVTWCLEISWDEKGMLYCDNEITEQVPKFKIHKIKNFLKIENFGGCGFLLSLISSKAYTRVHNIYTTHNNYARIQKLFCKNGVSKYHYSWSGGSTDTYCYNINISVVWWISWLDALAQFNTTDSLLSLAKVI